ncbi:hypothetical protein RND71_007166 [Anisodus tanguticus]|uniref:Mitochondrial carrier protein n=1 Tax=Anisodus tanguticus TaxID=243964 RepID=A0AAE1VJV9_9SOLA|nr:hypothetical protein RND71_007166 [Anisodus tanguticus]
MTSSLSPLGTALTIIFVISLLALFAQLLFLLHRRRRRNLRRDIPIHVHENVPEPSSSSKELLLFLFCLRNKKANLSRVEADPSPDSPDPAEMELIDLLKLHDMYGPSRFLFTIKEEEKEDLESEKSLCSSAEKTKSMSLQECMKIEEESPENSPESPENSPELPAILPEFPETLPELPGNFPEFPEAVLVGEEVLEEVVAAVAIDYDPKFTENETTPFTTPCDSPFYLTPVASPTREFAYICGGAAGAFAKTAVAPLERVKIIMQTRTEGFNSLGVYQSLKKIWKHEGIVGFYKGNGASVLLIVPYAALHFMAYERYRGWILNNYDSVVGTWSFVDLLAGSTAGGTATITYPLDVVRRQTQVEHLQPPLKCKEFYLQNRNTFDRLSSIVRNQGWRQLFAGLSINYMKIVPTVEIGFTAYDTMKAWLHTPPRQKTKSISTV